MLRPYILFVVLYCFIDGFVYEGLQVGSTPIFALFCNEFHCLFINNAQILGFFAQNLFKDALSLLVIRRWDKYLDVKATCTQDSVVYQIDTVGGCHNQNFFIGVKAIHFA